MQLKKSLDKLVALAGGCVIVATGGGSMAVGATTAASGASLLSAWLEGKAKHGPESRRVLSSVRDKVRAEFFERQDLSEEQRSLLEGADYALGRILLDCVPTAEKLAVAFGHPDGFSRAAARMIMAEVAAKDDLFAESGERSESLARQFATVAIEAAIETALTDREYFTTLLPFALESIKRDTSETRDELAHLRRLVENLAAQVATEQGASIVALREVGLLYGVQAPDANPQEILEALRSAARRMRHLEERLGQLEQESHRFTTQGNRLSPPLTEARQALLDGRLTEADRFITEALSVYADILDRQLSEVSETRRQMAQAYVLQAESAMLRLDYRAASAALDAASTLASAEMAFSLQHQAAEALYRQGLEFGDNEALEVALGRFCRLLTSRDRAIDPLGWAGVQQAKAATLIALGRRETETESLLEAVEASRAALEEYTPERSPLNWAANQTNLANALSEIGMREGRTQSLKAAITAYKAALEVLDRSETPRLWATAQNNMAATLLSLGEREMSKNAYLEEALEAHRAALEERPRNLVPLEWAESLQNLGGVLLRLGERDSDVARLKEAVSAFRGALKECKRERVPLDWATAQTNLGFALKRLGEYENSTARLKAAVTAYRAALKERTRSRVPFQWAATQSNLGLALLRLAETENGIKYLQKASVAFHAALEEWTRDRVPLAWATTLASAVLADVYIAERTGDATKLKAAAELVTKALAVAVEAAHKPNIGWVKHVLREIERVGQALASASE